MNRENGSVSVILAVVLGLLFVTSSIFGIWAFAGRQDYKNNVDAKIEDASAVAVQQAETAKDAEFTEKEKSPVRTYSGPATYGSLTFDYPKTWSLYVEEAGSGTVLDLFAFPLIVPGPTGGTQKYALRTEISSQSYDKEVKQLDQQVKTGKVKTSAYRPEKVPTALGIRVDGEIETGVSGSMILLPLRDKTIKIFTQIPEFVGDFDKIISPSISFIP
jgi:hypothetical protein